MFGVVLVLGVSAFGAIAALRHYELTHALAPTITLATTVKQPQTPTLAWPSYGQAAIATEQQGVVATHGAQTLPCKESDLGTTKDSRVRILAKCADVDIWQSLCTELPERGFKRDLTN